MTALSMRGTPTLRTDINLSGYTLTQCAFILRFGKLYQLFSPKWTFLASLFVFEIGSLVCGVAPTSIALIIGVRMHKDETLIKMLSEAFI